MPNYRTQLIRAETKVLDAKTGLIEAVVSTEDIDRHGDIIRQAFWDFTEFKKHPVLVASHNYGDLRAQIGDWQEMKVVGTKTVGKARYYVGLGNEMADWGFTLASMGRAAYSVGFQPDMEKAVLRDDGGWPAKYEFKGQSMLEVSQVVVPANAQALQTVKGLLLPPPLGGIVDELLAEMAAKPFLKEKAMTKAMTDMVEHLTDCPECREQVGEHMAGGKRLTVADFNRVLEEALKKGGI